MRRSLRYKKSGRAGSLIALRTEAPSGSRRLPVGVRGIWVWGEKGKPARYKPRVGWSLVQDPSRISVLSGIYPALGIWFVVDIVGAVSYPIWPRVRPVPAPVAGENPTRCRSFTRSSARNERVRVSRKPKVSPCTSRGGHRIEHAIPTQTRRRLAECRSRPGVEGFDAAVGLGKKLPVKRQEVLSLLRRRPASA